MWDMMVRSSQRLDAFDQWCLRHILRVPFTAHVTNQEVRLRSAQPPVRLSPRRSCSGVWGSLATSSVLTPMRIIHVPSMLASMTRGRSGNDLVVALVKHGYTPSRMTSNIRTWDCGRPGTELMTVICGVISWKRRRSCMLHADDDPNTTPFVR